MGKKVYRTATGYVIPHGTTSSYNNHDCRCRSCTEAWRIWHRDYLHRTGRTRPIEVVNAERRAAVKHGSKTMYVSYGCRCDECREGSRRRRAEVRAGQRSRRTPLHVHGTTNGYQNYGCRCDDCSWVASEIARTRYARRKANA